MIETPLIIICPVVGAELTRDMYPNLPLTPEEIAEASRMAVESGASVIHLHVRDENGFPTQRVDVFEEVSEKIRERCDCILQYSTGGAVGTPLLERAAPLLLKPEMATVSLGTMNFGDDIYENSQNTIRAIYHSIRENGIMPEIEIFDAGMMDTLIRFLKKGVIDHPFHVDFVLGVPGGMTGDLRNLLFLMERLPADQTWSVAGVGRYQLPLAVHAISLGGHVRIGIEDNIFYRKNEPAASNAMLIDRIARIAKELDRPVATPEQTREILGLSGK